MLGLKHLARDIFLDTLKAIDIPRTIQQKVRRVGTRIYIGDAVYDLARYRRIVVIAIGKAAPSMARGVAETLSGIAFTGILVAPHDAVANAPGFVVIGAGHPVPDAGSVNAARRILALLSGCDSRSFVFFLLSGGASTLIELPLDSRIELPDLQEMNRLLVSSGAPIDHINAVRKHLSAVKGGRLAAAAPAAMKVTLAVTDVPLGRESALGSGPTLPDPTTVADACRVIEQYALLPKLPAAIRTQFENPGEIVETPKPGDPIFKHAAFELLLGMNDLFHRAHHAAETRGFVTWCDNSTDDWPIGKASDYLLRQLDRLSCAHHGSRVALIADGELSSPWAGTGVGGRNSAFVLENVAKIAGKHMAVLSGGTDGKDGGSPAAGAVADGSTLERAMSLGLNPAEFMLRSDSYTFFKLLGDAIETGPTGNNLRDLRILLAEPI